LDKESKHHDPQARHRHELAEPPWELKKLKSPRAADGVAERWDTAKVRKSDHVSEN